MLNPNDPLAAFVIALLDDDEGINAVAYEKLMDMLSKQGESDLLWFLEENVDCGQKYEDTRYFLPFKVVKNLSNTAGAR